MAQPIFRSNRMGIVYSATDTKTTNRESHTKQSLLQFSSSRICYKFFIFWYVVSFEHTSWLKLKIYWKIKNRQ